MRTLVIAGLMVGALSSAAPAHAQTTVMPNAAPENVTERLRSHLANQGFVLERSDLGGTLFTLDRGMVAQNAAPFRGTLVPIVLELHFRYKQVKSGLQVKAREEVVGHRGKSLEFRRPVQSQAELGNLQRLLDRVGQELAAADTTSRPESK